VAVSDQLSYCLMPRTKQQNRPIAYVLLTCLSASRTDITVVCINREILNSKYTAKFLDCHSFIFVSLKILLKFISLE